VVLTHRRPRLATQVVRALHDVDAVPLSNIVLVVNGEGGLDDTVLESAIDVVRLPVNVGPAGGFRAGMEHAASRIGAARWLYLCEDDVGLFGLPPGRLGPLIAAVEARGADGGPPVGAVVAYGRDLHRRTGITLPHQPGVGMRFESVDVAAWGASLVSAKVLEAGVLPDAEWFFGFEDFDFWLSVTRAGFALLLDDDAARAVAAGSRDEAFQGERPIDGDEPWRAYYASRNFLELARRHGNVGWTSWHLLKSIRRLQRAPSSSHRRAIVRGVWDGLRGRLGVNPKYVRQVGEW
jgi:GT2 family glycosyltransferase